MFSKCSFPKDIQRQLNEADEIATKEGHYVVWRFSDAGPDEIEGVCSKCKSENFIVFSHLMRSGFRVENHCGLYLPNTLPHEGKVFDKDN